MSADSGLPVMRGADGMWVDYAPARALGLDYQHLATMEWYDRDPGIAWGFVSQTTNAYRKATPHDGYKILYKVASRKTRKVGGNYFVMSSNVDTLFTTSGFARENVYQVHGNMEWLQCRAKCRKDIVFPTPSKLPALHPTTHKAVPPYPKCPYCGSMARWNVSYFGDLDFCEVLCKAERRRLQQWITSREVTEARSFVILEVGCGMSEHSLRMNMVDGRWKCLSAEYKIGVNLPADTTLIRINPLNPEVPPDVKAFGIPLSCEKALKLMSPFLRSTRN
ncbi:NAD-dependent deacetylase [Pelomyxa schiedti]|nr:NAD-dependent deacetylase [Pelomyxa schiedti]